MFVKIKEKEKLAIYVNIKKVFKAVLLHNEHGDKWFVRFYSDSISISDEAVAYNYEDSDYFDSKEEAEQFLISLLRDVD